MQDWLTDLVGLYFERVLRPRSKPRLRNVSAREVGELVWELLPLFRPKMPLIDSTGYRAEFEHAADKALLTLVESDGFDGWTAAPLGAWHVLWLRYCFLLLAVVVEEPEGIMIRLPVGLSEAEQRQACALFFLLGPARDVPGEWKQELPSSLLQRLLAASPPRL
jgi:hypothetical protein